jgi:hypothetical protein
MQAVTVLTADSLADPAGPEGVDVAATFTNYLQGVRRAISAHPTGMPTYS